MFSTRHTALWLVACAAFAGCAAAPQAPVEPGVQEATREGPPGAAPGSCWGKTVRPAVIETVTEQVQVTPARLRPDGTVASPPVYHSESRQRIVTPRESSWFETPCPETLTPELIETLQRALAARSLYAGPITGVMDAPTRAAVRAYQRLDGPDSSVLSLATSRALGLIAVPREPET